MMDLPDQVPYQRSARLYRQGDAYVLQDVRYGFVEHGPHLEDWKPRFGTARVQPGHVAHVYVGVSPFPPPETIAGHAFLIFQFDDGYGLEDIDGLPDSALVLSVEAQLRRGQSFSLIGGSMGAFPILYQFGSWRDIVHKDCRGEGRCIVRYRLALTWEQKQRLLANVLEDAVQHGDEAYNTLNNSCFTNVVRLLNTVLTPRQKLRQWFVPRFVHDPMTTLPALAGVVLDMDGLLRECEPVLTQPDATRFPKWQQRRSGLHRPVRRLVNHGWWTPGCEVAVSGALGVLAARKGMGAAIAATFFGRILGKVIAETIALDALARYEASEPYSIGHRALAHDC